MKTTAKILVLLVSVQFFFACSATRPPLSAVDSLELESFMGDWYVIGFIPLAPEKKATNAIENYALREDGNVDITYTFYKGNFDGEKKTFRAKGFVPEEGKNSEWRVQFFWPLKLPYFVIDLAEDYSYTVVGIPNRKNVWIMAREPFIPEEEYANILVRLEGQGYNIEKIRKVPQNWRGMEG